MGRCWIRDLWCLASWSSTADVGGSAACRAPHSLLEVTQPPSQLPLASSRFCQHNSLDRLSDSHYFASGASAFHSFMLCARVAYLQMNFACHVDVPAF